MKAITKLGIGLCIAALSVTAIATQAQPTTAGGADPVQGDEIYEACVGTCKGTYCDEAFADVEFALEFIDDAEDDCEKNGKH